MADQATKDAHPHAQKLRKGFEAYAKGNLEEIAQMFHDDVKIHILSETSPFAGDHHGVQGLRQLFSNTRGQTEEDSWQVADLLVDDDYVVALTHMTGKRKGRFAGTKDVQVFRMKDGKVSEAWYINTDKEAPDAEFWKA
jgi:hypothetical protein